MEFTVHTNNIEDAEDLFLLAKERLLDVNEWQRFSGESFMLTDKHGQKLHRNAHRGDHIKIANQPDLIIGHIIYDDFPDVLGESITLVLSGGDDLPTQEILIKRIGKLVSVSADNLLMSADASAFLKGIIVTKEYAIAS